MIPRTLVARRPRRTALAAAATLAAALTTVTAAGTVQAAEPPDPDLACTPYDGDSDLDAAALTGMAVTGLTTSTGTAPDTFTGEVLGVVDDGIAPGIDMIMARLESPALEEAGGVWFGMSGSPVYAPDGTLLGAVAYGMSSAPSPVAGITPAAALLDVADRVADVAPALEVRLPASLQRRLVGRGRLSTRAATAGMRALKIPMGASGVPSDVRLRKVKRDLGITGVRMFRSSPSPVSASAAPAEAIVPGGNVGAGLSYGEVSLIAFGTATAVCDGEVVGFGHPFEYAGDTTLSLHGASTVYIQDDAVLGSFKVVNPSAPVGTVSQDRLAGIAGALGEVPESTLVTTTVTEDADGDLVADPGERTRTSGATHVTRDSSLDYVTWVAQLLNIEVVVDSFGPGAATTRYTVTGSTRDGGTDTAFTLERGNRFQSDYAISSEPASEAADTVATLFGNRFTDVDFDTVTVDSVYSTEPRLFRVKEVELRRGTEWQRLRNSRFIDAEPGSTLRFRVTLDSPRDAYGTRTVRLDVPVPEVTRSNVGFLTISGGAGYGLPSGRPASFADLVTSIESAPRHDDLVGELFVRERRSPRVHETVTEPVGDVVRGGQFFELSIRTPGVS